MAAAAAQYQLAAAAVHALEDGVVRAHLRPLAFIRARMRSLAPARSIAHALVFTRARAGTPR